MEYLKSIEPYFHLQYLRYVSKTEESVMEIGKNQQRAAKIDG